MLGYPEPLFLRWHGSTSSSGQSRQVPPGRDAHILIVFVLDSADARCKASALWDSPALIGGSFAMACRTVCFFAPNSAGVRSRIGPRREARTTTRCRR